MNLKDKLKSRKFWMTVATVAYAILGAITGNLEWLQACKIVLTAVGIYTGAEALVDIARSKK